ncbi:MAG: RNA methyltransferase [Clostridia bacterium]|nr:RNA methyltransferase [Clostridia bacterium]
MRKETKNQEASVLFEGMTSINAVIDSWDNGGRRILRVFYDESKRSSKTRELSFLFAMGEKYSFDMIPVPGERIDELAVGNSHGGIIAECSERAIPELDRERIKENGFYVMIEGIEDPYNFGYAVRSLYAAGADGIILPGRNWMSAAGVVCRSSAGASERIKLLKCGDPLSGCRLFRESGYKIICAGIRNSVSIYDADLKKPILLIVGGEKRGISRALLDESDETVRIDYAREFRGSLSTASAVTVIAFEVARQNK